MATPVEGIPTQPDSPQLFVVGLGASAGGITALKEFFRHVAPQPGAAFVVILHLSPDHDSRLAEVLQVAAPMPVQQVVDRTRIDADHIYVVPPNKSLEIVDDHLVVSEITRPEQRRAPVDVFFRALADSHGSRAVCVVLSGTGPNGSAGLKRIKEYGGLVIAQEPREAEYSDMPRNAIATGMVDFVLPIAEMPGRIALFHERLSGESPGEDAALATTPTSTNAEALRDILTLLRVRTGHDFSNYKPATLHRRIQRRIHLRGLPTIGSYARAIREQPDEAVVLMRELLISVTNFFRDPVAWDALEARFIPRLFLHKRAHDQVRVWVPGCATGEEAYSIAMLLAEHGATTIDQPSIQVFGSDLDERAIALAREGFYTDAEIADVSEERLQRFFQREAGGYRVRRELRETLLFAHHNVIKDPPFSHLDLISCRNLLIYLNRSMQERVVEAFHFALRPGGLLFLGAAESPDSGSDFFLTVDKGAHVYESRSATSRSTLPLVEMPVTVPRVPVRPENRHADRVSPAELHQRLLEQYAPPSVIVTDEHNVVHLSARAGRYMQVAGGEPSRDLLRLVRAELRADLRAALHQAAREQRRVEVRGVPLSAEAAVNITVAPVLPDGDALRGFFLVLFEDDAPAEVSPEAVRLAATTEPIAHRLKEELGRVRAQLRTTVEQYETEAEDSKGSNEELQAINEELRSAAEELETSKEELQSVNEELTTVNQELKIKIEELAFANNDFQNLINSNEIGTIFLDRELRVKLSTPAARRVFNLLHTDTGRPLADITSHLVYDGLHDDLRRVQITLQPVESEVQTRDGSWQLVRLRPYRTTDDRIDGVVITLQDITERRQADQRVRASEERLRLLVDSALDYAMFMVTSEGRIDAWYVGAERIFGYRSEDVIGKPFDLLFTPEDREVGVPRLELERASRQGRTPDERFYLRKTGERFYASGTTTRLSDGSGFAKIARDLTRLHQIAQDQDEVSSLMRKLVVSQEDDRARIARNLHDQLGQQLTGLRLLIEGHGSPEQVLALVGRIDSELEFLAWELRPALLDDLGLAAALPRFVEEWSVHHHIAAEIRTGGYNANALPREVEVAFYRIGQEALTNVVKHAHASRVDVLLENRDHMVVLVIDDDGVGFEMTDSNRPAAGLGLLGMKERATLAGATLEIESRPGGGTSVFLRAPIRT